MSGTDLVVYEERRNPNPDGRPIVWTIPRVKAALIRARGIHSAAARLLSVAYNRACARETVSRLVARYPELQEVARSTREALLDLAEDRLIAGVEAGDQRDVHFLLRFQGRSRGYSTRHELTGENGKPIQVQDTRLTDEQIANLSDDELVALMRAEEVKQNLKARQSPQQEPFNG